MSNDGDWAQAKEQDLLDAALRLAPRFGWTLALVRQAGRDVGLSASEAELLLPEGPRDLAALLSRRLDRDTLAALAEADPAAMKMRERIRRAVSVWLAAAGDHEPAVRRWTGFLALPGNLALGLRLAWASADGLWRWAGDTATDENHYSKRVLLAEILISSLAIRLASGAAAAEGHVEQRIARVMAFEKWKASVTSPSDLAHRGAAFLGRFRYGRSRSRDDAAALEQTSAEP
ncbi:MAG: COQ9 family protein [Caulobacteraceae bacterium]|nr:COQ9 family protein [Caulobacteraceae bacterium]